QHEGCVLDAAEGETQEHEDGDQRHGNDDHELLLRELHLVELPRPADGVAAIKIHVAIDELLRRGDSAAQIAPAHAEFDGDVALPGFAIDEKRSVHDLDVGDQAYRDAAAIGG